MSTEADGNEVKAEVTQPLTKATPGDAGSDESYEMVSEETPLVDKVDEKPSGKSFVPVIKDEQEAPAKVTTTEVTDEGVPPKNFVEVMKEVANNVGKGTGEFASVIGKKTKEITDHVGGETKKLTDNVVPHVSKFGENVGRGSQMLAANVGKSTRQLSEHVGKESQKVAANVGNATRQLSEHVGRESQKVGQRTAIVAEHVGRESKKLAETVGKETKQQYDKIAPIVEPHAKKYSSLLNGTAPDLMTDDDDSLWKQLLDGTARSYGWVVFCNNSFTGAMIALAMLISSPLAFICSLYCAGLTNFVAVLVGLDRSVMRRGHFASNSVLVGSGIATYFTYEGAWGWLTLILVATLGAPVVLLATLFTARLLAPMGLPTLLFPYIGVMVFVVLGSQVWKSASLAAIPIMEDETFHIFEATFKGISQIFLINNGWSGFLMFVGMIACSRVIATASFIGSALSSLLGMAFFAFPMEGINAGLLGFNSALSFPALLFFLVPTWKSLLVAVLGVLMTLGADVGFNTLFLPWSIPVMLFPFCFAMLPFLALDLGAMSGADGAFVTVIPLDNLSTPEEHLKRCRNEATYTEIPDVDEEAYTEIPDAIEEEVKESKEEEVETKNEEEMEAPPKEAEPKEEAASSDLNV